MVCRGPRLQGPARAFGMTVNWAIRSCGPADAPALALVGAATFLETFANVLDGADVVAHCQTRHSARFYADWLESGASAWLAETHGGAPIGYAVLAEPDLPLPDLGPGDIELKRIYTLSRFHGAGLGGAFMAAALDAAIEAGRDRLLLGVYAGNERAIAFYRKQGFERIGERRFKVGAHSYDDVILARRVVGSLPQP